MKPYRMGIAVALVVIGLVGPASADTIVLKSGSKLMTRKAWVEKGEVKFYLGDIEASYRQEDVLEIIPEGQTSRLPQPTPIPADGPELAPAEEKPREQPRQQSRQNFTRATEAETSPELIVAAINLAYGNVCKAQLTGWLTKTLQIDWTAKTNKFVAAKVLADIGNHKEQLYAGGVRYLQFPNNAGTYNVIDWKTGTKTSIGDSAPYHFK